jgi:AcrR family transcriptional regulator
VKRKAAYHHGDLRRVLLDASLSLIDERGLAGLSLREVARRAGVTHQAPYHHFKDRAALLAALADEGFALLLASMQAQQAKARRSPEAQLTAAGLGYVKFALEHPAHFRLMFRPELREGAAASQASAAAYALLVDSVTAVQKAGAARRGNTAALVALCWSVVHGLASLWLDGPLAAQPRAPQEVAREVVDLLVRMLAADARKPPSRLRKRGRD